MPRNTRYSPEVRERAVRMVARASGRVPLGVGGLHLDRRQARHDARDAPDLGPPGPGRRGPSARAHHRRAPEAEGPREGGQRAPAGQRNIEGRLDFLRDRARRSNRRSSPLHRFSEGSLGSRADLHHAAVRFPHLLRRQAPAAVCPQGPRRGAQARDRPGPRREPRRLWGRQGLDPDEAGGPPGRPLHGRAPHEGPAT